MKRLVALFLLIMLVVLPVSAEMTAPEVPESGTALMPRNPANFGEGLQHILKELLPILWPELRQAMGISAGLVAVCMLVCLLRTEDATVCKCADIVGAAAISALLVTRAGAMIRLGETTVLDLSEYEKLLLPAMTAAMAAQGGATAGTALYAGSAVFNTVLSRLLVKLMVPVQYLYLATAAAAGILDSDSLKNLKNTIKNMLLWCLKTILSLFTAYLGLTGVVSGTADAAVLKAAKAGFSTLIPVVGSILADASEAVLVGAGIIRSTMGIYGILATLAVFLEPFGRIGIQYLVLKLTGAMCAMFANKPQSGLIDDFGEVMRMLLAMTGAMCVLMLVSTVCFLKGVG